MSEYLPIVELFAQHILPSISKPLIEKTLDYAISHNSQIKDDLLNIQNSHDVENVLAKIKVVFEARAGDSSIELYQTVIQALGGATFDHEKGTLTIEDSTITAKVLVIGGSENSSGETTIGGNTEVGSDNAKMKITGNAQVKIKGNASIRFS